MPPSALPYYPHRSGPWLARQAGLLYLVVVITGLLHLMYIPNQIDLSGEADQVLAHLAAHLGLYKIGILVGALSDIAFLLLPLALYALLGHVHRPAAVVMVALAAVSVPISLGLLTKKMAVVALLEPVGYLSSLDTATRKAAILLELKQYTLGLRLLTLPWGLWLFPFGYLVYKSNMLPKLLGIFLMIGCFGYLTDFVGLLLFPGYNQTILSDYTNLPSAIGEVGICLWLLIKAVPAPKANTATEISL